MEYLFNRQTDKTLSIEEIRSNAKKQYEKRDYKDSFNTYLTLLRMPSNTGWEAGKDFVKAVACLMSLNRLEEMDALREEALALRPLDWEFASSASETFDVCTHGSVVEGKFIRGEYDVQVFELDRIFWMNALNERPAPEEGEHVKDYYLAFIRLFLNNRDCPDDLWRFQLLTDVASELDYTSERESAGGCSAGFPVDENGEPLFFALPDGWDDAKNDGERLRWLFHRLTETGGRVDALKLQVKIYWECYGTNNRLDVEDIDVKRWLSGLSEDETWTELATGTRRFVLPAEFNPILLCKELATIGEEEKLWAYDNLMVIYESRFQYEKAEDICEYLAAHALNDIIQEYTSKHLNAIRGNWCTIRGEEIQYAGSPATISLEFRNVSSASFAAYRIDLEKLADDTWNGIEYRKHRTSTYRDFSDLSSYLRTKDHYCNTSYLMDSGMDVEISEDLSLGLQNTWGISNLLEIRPFAAWTVPLTPLEGHLDSEVSITTPLHEAGAYLIFCKAPSGNISNYIIVIQELEIIEKKLFDNSILWQVLDSKTGCPQPNLPLDCLLVYSKKENTKKEALSSKKLTKTTDQNGCVVFSMDEVYGMVTGDTLKDDEIDDQLYNLVRNYDIDFLVKGKSSDGKIVYYKNAFFRSFYYDRISRKTTSEEETRHYLLTDRSVYRPGQQVHVKIWSAKPTYGEAGTKNPIAFQELAIRVLDAKDSKVIKLARKADSLGGILFDFDLPKDAALGSYHVQVYENKEWRSVGSFHVEEYRKPEFEVAVELPQKPVLFGETVPISIKAEYYFGAPVTDGEFSLKVTRRKSNSTWLPSGIWDWLYGEGYWWQFGDYRWHTERGKESLSHPYDSHDTPELVLELQGKLSEDGSYATQVFTANCLKKSECECVQYEVTAEVKDKSRRIVVGTGSFMASHEPFKVAVWLDHGYLSVGDKATAFMEAHSFDGKSVNGKGILALSRISYDNMGQVVEKPVRTWNVSAGNTEMQRRCTQAFSCSEAGQYRLSCQLTDDSGQMADGSLVFNVIGDGNDGRAFHYNGLELLSDKESYSPGETVRLLINTEQPDSTVMLFVRAEKGHVPLPQVLHLKGKSQIVEIVVKEEDKPNFFIEAYTLANGKLFEEKKEIIVPPTGKMLNVDILSSKQSYLPGETGSLALRITDSDGKPVHGSLVVTVYDKSLEYIVPYRTQNIRGFFWSWKRFHRIIEGRHNFWDAGEVYYWDYGGKFDYQSLGCYQCSFKDSLSIYGGHELCCGCASDQIDCCPEEPSLIEKQEESESLVKAVVRSYFADTALWVGELEADDNGMATVKLSLPENLTTWKIRVWSMAEGTCVGEGTAEVKTAKNLLVRLQAPRFYVERDEVVISAIVHNYLDHEKKVMAELELEGGNLKPIIGERQWLMVPSQRDCRVDWRVKAVQEGTAVIRVKAQTDEESDAVEQSFSVLVHGMVKRLASCVSMEADETQVKMAFEVPAEIRAGSARLEISWSPSLALSMVDALPYLLDYPYGCSEQTLNRFLPAVQTKKVLDNVGLKLSDIESFTEHLDYHGEGMLGQIIRERNGDDRPVWNDDMLDEIVSRCIEKLKRMQCADGGWSWFSGSYEQSGAHTTAQVVQGLLIASHQCGIKGLDALLASGLKCLNRYLRKSLSDFKKAKKEERTFFYSEVNAFVFSVLAFASSLKLKIDSSDCVKAGQLLFEGKNMLSLYGLALLGMGMHYLGRKTCCDEIIHNLCQYLKENPERQTAWLNIRSNRGWFWYDDADETHAIFIKLLALNNPYDELLPKLVKYLLNNRRNGTYWKSTRDTALCIDALSTYIMTKNELGGQMHIELCLDGNIIATSDIVPKKLDSLTGTCLPDGAMLTSGTHELTVRKTGKDGLYVSSVLSYFSCEEFIGESGLGIKVRRTVSRLCRADGEMEVPGMEGRPAAVNVEKHRREKLSSGDAVNSGDLLEVELVLECENDYEYLLLEDMFAAGTTPVESKSGYNGNELGAYVEFHDSKVSYFIQTLSRGLHRVTYRLRAEVPGTYSAMPATVSSMYDPDLCGNSSESKLEVKDE